MQSCCLKEYFNYEHYFVKSQKIGCEMIIFQETLDSIDCKIMIKRGKYLIIELLFLNFVTYYKSEIYLKASCGSSF